MFVGNLVLGGMTVLYKSFLYVTDSIIKSNDAEKGGVAFLLKSSAVFASSELKGCSAST